MKVAFLSLILIVAIGLGVVSIPMPCHADIYRYVDKNGTLHFTNVPTGGQYTVYMKEEPPPRVGPAVEPFVGGDLDRIILKNSSLFGLEEALVRAVIKAESNYDARAVSKKGAQGIMQLIPETAREMNVGDPFNPDDNIRGGSRYLRQMLDQFGSLELALAAYNAGPGAVKKHGGVPPYQETRQYVDKVKRYLRQYRQDRTRIL